MPRPSDYCSPGSLPDAVVITGLGTVTPLGGTAPSSWTGLLAGKSAVRRLSPADFPASLSTQGLHRESSSAWIGSPAVLEPGTQTGQTTDRVIDLAVQASHEAWQDAGLTSSLCDTTRLGCVFGTSKGSLFAATACYSLEQADEATWSQVLQGPGLALDRLCRDFSVAGPSLCPVAACATGVAAVIRGAQLIESGECDVVIAGSADDSLHPLVLASFQRMGVLAQHPNPAYASRPFDRNRNGFVIGAGAGCLILESRSHALARKRDWYAVLGDKHLRSDPTGMTSLDVSGEALTRLITDCSRGPRFGEPRVPDVVNLHGTGTVLNDTAECRALQRAYGERLQTAACGSLKGSLGHLLGAAGSVELAMCCLMLRDQTVPPNVNLDDVDPACDLPWVRTSATERPIESLLKLSLGFGGHQAGLWLLRGTRPERSIR